MQQVTTVTCTSLIWSTRQQRIRTGMDEDGVKGTRYHYQCPLIDHVKLRNVDYVPNEYGCVRNLFNGYERSECSHNSVCCGLSNVGISVNKKRLETRNNSTMVDPNDDDDDDNDYSEGSATVIEEEDLDADYEEQSMARVVPLEDCDEHGTPTADARWRDTLGCIWESLKIKKMGVKGLPLEQWQCLHCTLTFNKWNATKALRHVVRLEKGKGITLCKGKITQEFGKRYLKLHNGSRKKKVEQIVLKDKVQEEIEEYVTESTGLLEDSRKRGRKNSGNRVSSLGNSRVTSSGNSGTSTTRLLPSTGRGRDKFNTP